MPILVTLVIGAFEIIDAAEGLLEGGGGLGAEELGIGLPGDGAQGLLVELLLRKTLDATRNPSALGSDGHGVDADAEGGGEAGRLNGVELARVVGSVGDQDHDLALGLPFGQAGGRGRDGRTDRGLNFG